MWKLLVMDLRTTTRSKYIIIVFILILEMHLQSSDTFLHYNTFLFQAEEGVTYAGVNVVPRRATSRPTPRQDTVVYSQVNIRLKD